MGTNSGWIFIFVFCTTRQYQCKQLSKLWAELAEQDSTAIIMSVDCSEQQWLCTKLLVDTYPTTALFLNGKKVWLKLKDRVLCSALKDDFGMEWMMVIVFAS